MKNIILIELMQKVWLRAGLNLTKHTRWINFMVVFLAIILSNMTILAVLVPILEESNLTTIADAFQIASPVLQVLIKLVVVIFSMKKVRTMLGVIETQFWSKDKFDQKLESELLMFEKSVNRGFKYTLGVVYIFSATLYFRPLLSINSSREYPVLTYNIVDINDNKMYAVMYGYQAFVFIFGPNLLLGIDGLYILFTINLYVQLKMLKYAFAELRIDQIENDADEERVYLKLKEYVDHHNLILKFIKDFGQLFSFQILCQFLGNTLSFCMGIFLFYGKTTDVASLIRTICIITVFIAELVFFCAGGTLISELCQDIAPIVFYNGWESMYSKRIRFAVLMIIMRSNKPETLKAGEMFYVNLTTIGQILKAAVSTFTLMTNVSSRKDK